MRVFGELGLNTVSHGYRVKDYQVPPNRSRRVNDGASSPILSELIPANMWLVAVEDDTRCLDVAQDINNFCKARGGIVFSRLAEVVDILRHVEESRVVFNGNEPRVGGDELAEDGRGGPVLYAPRSMRN